MLTAKQTSVARGVLRIALAGNPNSGKTTVFNALTGLRQRVANYPGVTVEKKTGRCRLPGGETAEVIDLPGTYSLVSRSPDEQVACEVLRGLREDTPPPDVVVTVVDASNLPRNLYLVSQVLELGRPVVVALTMMDVAERRGLRVSAEKLEARLGVPVVPMVGHKGVGVGELKRRIGEAKLPSPPDLPWPGVMREEVMRLAGAIRAGRGGPEPGEAERYRSMAQAERLLIGDAASDLSGLLRSEEVRGLVSLAKARLSAAGVDPIQADVEAHYQWIDRVALEVTAPKVVQAEMTVSGGRPRQSLAGPTATDRLDRVLMHRVWGMAVFAVVMAVLFYAIFWLADPVMGATEDLVAWTGGLFAGVLPEGPIRDLWKDGIVAGVGAVVVFVPQIAMLFGFLAVLEDSGYLARAAFLMDRLLSKVGLSGKAFVPLLSSFACAIPGIMATRTIENPRERLATIFVAPFMSCSARLPVYTLLIGTFFAAWGPAAQAGVMFGLYVLGVVAAAGTAWVMQRFLAREGAIGFVLELPAYKLPQVSQVLRQMWNNTGKFVTRAGTIIFCLSIVLWAMTYYPRLSARQAEAVVAGLHADTAPVDDGNDEALGTLREQALAAAQLRQSISGRLGHLIEPAIRPLGFDWKMGVGLISAFAAREVFVSTMGIVYSVGGAEEDPLTLRDAMLADRYTDGRPVWTLPVAMSLLVWFVIAMQCMSTLAVVRRETGTWWWPVVMLAYMNALAYVVALITYQLLVRLVGGG